MVFAVECLIAADRLWLPAYLNHLRQPELSADRHFNMRNYLSILI